VSYTIDILEDPPLYTMHRNVYADTYGLQHGLGNLSRTFKLDRLVEGALIRLARDEQKQLRNSAPSTHQN